MTWRDAAIGRIISQSDFFEPLSPGLPHHARFRRRVYFPTGKGFIALQIMPAPTPRNKAVAMPNTLFIVVSISLLVIVFSEALRSRVYAQDLEPRAYAVTPVGLNFLIGGYAYSKGAVGTDPSVPIEDAEVKVNSAVVAYVRTLDLWGRSGKFDIILPYSWVSGSAKF
ncbi:MAG TPA: hypothetical protein VLD83_13465, partial [Candidatus Binatia bacterium]|nr:hypothetical protein [Candidatus Binatia bacterium]